MNAYYPRSYDSPYYDMRNFPYIGSGRDSRAELLKVINRKGRRKKKR